MWFGVDDTSKVALILYAAFFQVLVNTIAGVVATDHSLMEAASCMGASRLRVFFTVVLPSAVPNIFTGIRLGLSSSIICVIAADFWLYILKALRSEKSVGIRKRKISARLRYEEKAVSQKP